MQNLFFPHEKLRDVQDKLIEDIGTAISSKRSIIAHAPTGLGKTAAALAPALTHAIDKEELTIFFLTSRHTQHKIAVETVKEIKDKFNLKFSATDIIGKKWMCPVPGTELLRTNEFSDYCKAQREENKCEYYSNTKKGIKLSVLAKKILKEISVISPAHSEDVISLAAKEKLCPYELSLSLASKSKVIIADYYYVFHPSISELFFKKINKNIQDSIIIVDEGHNLPVRLRDLMTKRLSNFMVARAVKEAKKFGHSDILQDLAGIQRILNELSKNLKDEKLTTQKEFTQKINDIRDYDEIIADFEFAADRIREMQKQSYIGSIASFLDSWRGPDKGYARIISVQGISSKPFVTLSYRCLDPSIVAREIISKSYSTILMSGTLNPPEMYKELLGFPENTILKSFKSPFPKKNQLNLIIPQTTTKFTDRSPTEFKKIGIILSEIINIVPGNSAVFFPSYSLRDNIYRFLRDICKKTTFLEDPNMTKKEKIEMLENFKKYKKQGAALLGVAAANFAEGIDLPGDLLKAVIVVGLPLQRPDLETKELIQYYDEMFGKGWDYGYIFPGFNKALQSAGRCIRSETDKGVIIFLDKRYVWPNYMRCFPDDTDLKISEDYYEEIKGFFVDGQQEKLL